MEWLDKVPSTVQAAFWGLVLLLMSSLAALIKAWVDKRLLKGALANVVEAVETKGNQGKAAVVAETMKLNMADGIEARVNPVIVDMKDSMPIQAKAEAARGDIAKPAP